MYANTLPAHASSRSERPTYLRDVLPILMGKCGRCHNEQTSFLQNWLDYSAASQKRWEIKRRVWDSWHGAYFKQPMPTGNSPESLAITEEERATIRAWVEWGAELGVAPPEGSAQTKAERIDAGKRLFATVCAACHQPGGQGIPGRFPPLARSDFLNSDKHRAIKIVMNGFQGEVVVNGQAFNNSMPKFPLTDQDIASALTYVYNSFGNSGKDVTAEEVRTVRGEKNDLQPLAHNASPSQEKSPFE
jgi:mono/diheme cytochrome c family protein